MTACEKTLKELRDAVQEALKPEPKPKASCYTFELPAGDFNQVSVRKGQVVFVSSATLAGRVRCRRYKPSDRVMKERREQGDDSVIDDEDALECC